MKVGVIRQQQMAMANILCAILLVNLVCRMCIV